MAVAGLAAAVRLRDRAPADVDITVYEQSGALGGKLRTGELVGGRSSSALSRF